MSEDASGGVWVVRVWPEPGTPTGLRARITASVISDHGESASEQVQSAGSIAEIERGLHEFLAEIGGQWSHRTA